MSVCNTWQRLYEIAKLNCEIKGKYVFPIDGVNWKFNLQLQIENYDGENENEYES